MERMLVVSAFAVGWLGWLLGILGTWSRRGPSTQLRSGIPRLLLLACLLAPLIVFLVTLPDHAPFAAGQGFGRGFVIGAFGALLAGWLLARAGSETRPEPDNLAGAAVTTGSYFLGVAAIAMPVLWMHTVLTDALLGVAIGWFVNTFLLALAPSDATDSTCGRIVAAVLGVGFTATLAIAVALGDYRGGVRLGSTLMPISWRGIVLSYGALIPVVMLCCALPAAWIAGVFSRLPLARLFVQLGGTAVQSDAARSTLARTWRLSLAAVLMLCIARPLAARLEHHPPLFALTGMGLASALIAWWLTDRNVAVMEEKAGEQGVRRQNVALAVTVILCATMAAYQMFAGAGLGFVLLSGWLIGGLSSHGSRMPIPPDNANDIVSGQLNATLALPVLLNFGLQIEIYRLLLVRFATDLRGVNLSDHYAFFGMMIGALLPILITGYMLKENRQKPVAQGELVGRAVVAGALVLCAPFALLLLFGAKCALALCFGLALGAVLPLLEGARIAESDVKAEGVRQAYLLALFPSLLAVATGLALAQWTHPVVLMALYARAEKLRLLGYLFASLIALLLATDYYGRYSDWNLRRKGPNQDGSEARRVVR